jgi:hypothetical protein
MDYFCKGEMLTYKDTKKYMLHIFVEQFCDSFLLQLMKHEANILHVAFTF